MKESFSEIEKDIEGIQREILEDEIIELENKE